VPLASRDARREYARKWMAARRAAWFAGKCCDVCGSAESLELDHVDPATKVSHRIWSWSESRRLTELAKCRSLCKACHKKRSDQQKRKPLVHGTLTGYWRHGCRCTACKLVRNTYEREKRKARAKKAA
jgi:hypothetical protein